MQREYFYKERGKLKPYIYCSLCGAGPFKKEDKEEIEHVAGERQKIYYCKPCKFAQSTRNDSDHQRKHKYSQKKLHETDEIVENEEEIAKIDEKINVENEPRLGTEKLNDLTLETTGKILTPLDGSCFVLFAKSVNNIIFCLSCNGDANQFIDNINALNVEYKKIKPRPLQLVYKRSVDEQDKIMFERCLKSKSKPFKYKLIANYNRTLEVLHDNKSERFES